MTLLASLTLATLAPAFHYHQFGEVTRMARDAGVSALMLGGTIASLSAAVRSVRRELESGTAAVALSHGISRGAFLLAKTLGVTAAYLLFAVVVSLETFMMVVSAWVGGALAQGDVARVWGPVLGCALVPIVLPLVLAAALNRFARWRFVLTAGMLTFVLACGCGGVAFCLCNRFGFPVSGCPVLGLTAMSLGAVAAPVPVWIAVAAGAARFRTASAGLVTALAVALTLPLGYAVLPALPLVLYLGCLLFEHLELS